MEYESAETSMRCNMLALIHSYFDAHGRFGIFASKFGRLAMHVFIGRLGGGGGGRLWHQ